MTNVIYLWFFVILISHKVLNLQFSDNINNAEIINGDVFFEIVDPVELEYTYRLRPAKDFGAPFNASFHIRNVPLVPVSPKYGCKEFHNLDDIEGNIAFIERGECSFKAKAVQAERAGARAAIITDVEHSNEEIFIEMIDDNTSDEVNIPAGYLMGKNGAMILHTLQKLNRSQAVINLPVNLTFTPVNRMNQPPWSRW